MVCGVKAASGGCAARTVLSGPPASLLPQNYRFINDFALQVIVAAQFTQGLDSLSLTRSSRTSVRSIPGRRYRGRPAIDRLWTDRRGSAGKLFAAYVERQLVPTLSSGDIVVLDNLSSRKHPEARKAIEAAGCTLADLPRYSPDLNPIELLFLKLKTLLRKHAERTIDTLWTRIGQLITEFSPDECRNDIRHRGYTAH